VLGRRGIKGGFQRKKGGARRFKTNGISLSCSQKPDIVPCHIVLWDLTSCLLDIKFNFNLKFIHRLLKHFKFYQMFPSSLLLKNLKIKIYRNIILSVVLYGCETWSPKLREESRMTVFENRMLRRIFESKRDEVTGEWKNYIRKSLMICTAHPLLCGGLNREE
jgi:hypothetical protein